MRLVQVIGWPFLRLFAILAVSYREHAEQVQRKINKRIRLSPPDANGHRYQL